MDNKAHTILVSVIASYGSRLTSSTANCKAFLADFMTAHADEKNVLIDLHQQQLTKVLYTFKHGAIDKKTLAEFINQLSERSSYTNDDLAWGVDAWANAVDLDIKTRRFIRKQCFARATRDLHIVTIRPIEAALEVVPEVPAIVIANANQATFPRMAILGIAVVVSAFSILQAMNSTEDNAVIEQIVAIEKPSTPVQPEPMVVVSEKPATLVKTDLPKVVSIKPRMVVAQQEVISPSAATVITPIDIDKLTSNLPVEAVEEVPEESIDFASAEQHYSSTNEPANNQLHVDIEAFLTQN